MKESTLYISYMDETVTMGIREEEVDEVQDMKKENDVKETNIPGPPHWGKRSTCGKAREEMRTWKNISLLIIQNLDLVICIKLGEYG